VSGLAWALVAAAPPAKEAVTIYRDNYGVPHIFAATEEGVCYGMGYAQAEDRLEELLRQYRRAEGTMAEAFGPSELRHDYRQRLWQHRKMAVAGYSKLDPKVRSVIEAYQAGIRQYIKEHPAELPAWAPDFQPWHCVALARYIIWGWPEGDAGGDMQRAGIQPDPIEPRGSNQWLVAAPRTAYAAPIALIDPHLSWYGQFRFYEARLYGGDIQMSGMAILGMPFPSLGHTRYCSIAMTTGGPDAADCYEEELNPANPRQYRYDGAWRDMTVVAETIRVKEPTGLRDVPVEIEYTHHGPVAAHKNGTAYVLKLPYFDQVQLSDQVYAMITAKNLSDMKRALGMLQLMEQNVMIGTVHGDIFYVRNGRVPIRPAGYDFKKPVPGNTSKTEWLGLHPLEDLVQLENPPQGYMQNCNVSPQFLMKDCPLRAERWADRPYLFNGFLNIVQRYDNPLHQRAAMCVELLHANGKMTTDDAIAIAMSPAVFAADVWQDKLRAAWAAAGKDLKEKAGPATMAQLIGDWNRRCDPDSTGAVAYRYWKDEFSNDVKLADRSGFPPPATLTGKEMLRALEAAAEKLVAEHGRLDVRYGDIYRVGRTGGRGTWPVGGGSVNAIATPRAISFERHDDKKTFIGRGGQTSTQVVLLTRPPRSWTIVPLGQSDHADSPHFDDQAEKLFSKGQMKPTYFLDREELLKHVEKKTTLEF
jgi:acyl-homoserine lactone acylase PvdQ